ncbi:MAG: serine hydrolase [Leucobacter sp.]
MVAIQSPSWSWAAGGVISTADDLTKWAHALGGSELLGEELHQEWLTDMGPMDPANPDDGPQYGLGIEQARFGSNRLYLHEGELPGFNTFVAVDPAHDVTIVIWTNLALSLDGQPNAKAVAGDVIGQLYTTPLGTPALPVD